MSMSGIFARIVAVIGAAAFTLLKELSQSEALLGPLAAHWQLSLGLAIIAFVLHQVLPESVSMKGYALSSLDVLKRLALWGRSLF